MQCFARTSTRKSVAPEPPLAWASALLFKTNIAMALVPASVAASGADVIVECRGNRVRAKQVPLPFYKRAKK